MKEIVLDPFTRIEGHLSFKIIVENEKVVDAYAKGDLWRGFESIVVGRDPRDAPIILSRICGVCHEVHRITSILAIEDASGFTPTDNAIRLRNLIEAMVTIYSHLAHLLVLEGPDFGVYGLAGQEHPNELLLDVNKYYDLLHKTILPTQKLCHEAAAIFGGKVPHHMTTLPGGVTTTPTPERISAAYMRMKQVKGTVDSVYNYVYDKLIPHLVSEHPEETEMLLNIGVGVENFLAYGAYPQPDEGYKTLFKRGIYLNGSFEPLNIDNIVEEVKHSWYTDRSGGKPAEEIPPEPQYGKEGAYSWAKAPRYKGYPCEVGPLARLIVSRKYEPLSKHKASVLDRTLARLVETKILTDKTLEWLLELKPDEDTYLPYEVPESGMGVGLWEAPRGALGHWIKISRKKIERYQCVVPTTWNISPRDARGNRGPAEESVIGAPVPGNKDVLQVTRILRSFDFCLACSIHLLKPDGKTLVKTFLTH